MFQAKKNDFLAGVFVSVLLSLFVNFTLLMRLYENSTKGGIDPFGPPVNSYFLYFSLGWFFLFAFLLFIVIINLFKLSERIFKGKEFQVFLFSAGVSLVVGFSLIQFYPVLLQVVIEDVIGEEVGHPMPYPHFRNRPPDREEILPDPNIPFIKPVKQYFFPRPLVTEHLFIYITTILIILVIRMLNTRQKMEIEFEKLRSEKWQTSYNALMGQINPHFFFNSLNGLNSLIRSGEKEQTLRYLDELSNVFRYILQSNKKELVTLAEEMEFVRAYTYLLSVRYEGKLFFSMQVDSNYLLSYLPILSVLPLVENAVKHNVISRQYPLQIDIYTTTEQMLVVSNKIQPKNEEGVSNGIDLKNLWGRYRMLTGKDIEISNRKEYFKVFLPLLNSLPKE